MCNEFIRRVFISLDRSGKLLRAIDSEPVRSTPTIRDVSERRRMCYDAIECFEANEDLFDDVDDDAISILGGRYYVVRMWYLTLNVPYRRYSAHEPTLTRIVRTLEASAVRQGPITLPKEAESCPENG